MREIRLVYNPRSRRGRVVLLFDKIAQAAQKRGYRLSLHRLEGNPPKDKEHMLMGLGDCSTLVACGGDGTLQMVADALVDKDMNIPVGLLPFGTSNDFADSVGLTQSPDTLFEFLDTDNIAPIDLGLMGDRCFINVFSAGNLTRASHGVERTFKDHLGMLAYYLHSVGNLPKIAPFKLSLKGDVKESFKCLLFLVMNSTSAGGFKNLAPHAQLDDGKLELIAVRECSLPEMAGVFWGVLRGEHQNNPSVLYTRVSELEVIGPGDVETDIDGEKGPGLPVKISVLPQRLRLLGAKN